MTSPKRNLSFKSSSSKTRFTRLFLRSLSRIRKQRNTSMSLKVDRHRRSRNIKLAAYTSMARAVGTSRAWSRALLSKIQSKARRPNIVAKRRSCLIVKKRRMTRKASSGERKQAEKLRSLVPGGEAMEFCELLEETADYIKCLATQVKVMQSIAGHLHRS